jgi:hypothetical protein
MGDQLGNFGVEQIMVRVDDNVGTVEQMPGREIGANPILTAPLPQIWLKLAVIHRFVLPSPSAKSYPLKSYQLLLPLNRF